jgi:hypothetical protein
MNGWKSYEGWRNYETWACNLWLTNDEGTYRHIRYIADSDLRAQCGDKAEAVPVLATDIENLIDEFMPSLGANLFGDLLDYAVQQIDFYEIAEAFLDMCTEADTDD